MSNLPETITFPDIQRMRREGMPANVAYLVYGRHDCECHGEPMGWNKDKQCKAGGYWVCRVDLNERKRERYHNDTEFREQKKERMRERRRALKAQGLCIDCGEPAESVLGLVRCWRCLLGNHASKDKYLAIKTIKEQTGLSDEVVRPMIEEKVDQALHAIERIMQA